MSKEVPKEQTITITAKDVRAEEVARKQATRGKTAGLIRQRGGLAILPEDRWKYIYESMVLNGRTIKYVLDNAPYCIGQNSAVQVSSHPEWSTYEEYVEGIQAVNKILLNARKARKEREKEARKDKEEQEAAKQDEIEFAKIDAKKLAKVDARVERLELAIASLKTAVKKIQDAFNVQAQFDTNGEIDLNKQVDSSFEKSDNQENKVDKTHDKFKPTRNEADPKASRPWWR